MLGLTVVHSLLMPPPADSVSDAPISAVDFLLGAKPLSYDRPATEANQITHARAAAEALFKPKKQVDLTAAPTFDPVAPLQVAQPEPRTPRIIAIPSTTPVIEATIAPATDIKPKSRQGESRRREKIPAVQHDRVRTLAQYGMTLAEVADLYGVSVDVVERIVGERTAMTHRLSRDNPASKQGGQRE
jgi:hypothetical protein